MSDSTASESSIGVLVVEDEAVAARAHAKYVDRLDGYHVAGVAKNATQAMAALTGQIYGLEPEEREQAIGEIIEGYRRYYDGQKVDLPGVIVLASGVR